MGQWNISINGLGAHHNADYDKDANKMAKEFVKQLSAAGHQIEVATFTHGGRDDVLSLAKIDDQAARTQTAEAEPAQVPFNKIAE